jgi:hypothetical protein
MKGAHEDAPILYSDGDYEAEISICTVLSLKRNPAQFLLKPHVGTTLSNFRLTVPGLKLPVHVRLLGVEY